MSTNIQQITSTDNTANDSASDNDSANRSRGDVSNHHRNRNNNNWNCNNNWNDCCWDGYPGYFGPWFGYPWFFAPFYMPMSISFGVPVLGYPGLNWPWGGYVQNNVVGPYAAATVNPIATIPSPVSIPPF